MSNHSVWEDVLEPERYEMSGLPMCKHTHKPDEQPALANYR